ncbi:MAG: hypothetical protein HGA19_04325 [Oscillochloris sp.]|nr:hypothetical protein [Oscillochloris sp.]
MGKRPTWLLIVAILLFSSVMAGCSSTNSNTDGTPAAATSGTNTDSNSYPYSPALETTVDPAYPAPEPEPTPTGRAPEPVPTPVAGMAVIHGQLYNNATDKPLYDGVIVYLSKLIATDSNTMNAVTNDTTIDPRIVPDSEGGFVFDNITPGAYGIVVQGASKQYLTQYASDRTKSVVVTVEAGQTLEVGKIYTQYP